MAVLKLEPTKAPNFSGVSYILQNAGLSMNRAFESASGLLGKYQEGAQEKVDNEIFSEIAGLDREGLQKYFEGGKLKGRAMSGDMREFLGKQFGAIADVNQTRAGTAETLSGTVRSEAVEGRQATDFKTREDQRLAIQGAGAQLLDAQRASSGERTGVPGPGTAANDPIAAAAETGTGSRAPAHLVGNESGGSFQATNESVGSGGIVGHDGRVQAGGARIQDAKDAGILPKNMTREEFRASEPLQIAFENWHFGDIDDNIEKNGYSQYIGTKINGVTVTHAGMVDVQHLGGATGLKKFLESGGKYNKADDNGTTLTDYLQMGGKAAVGGSAGATRQAPQASGSAGAQLQQASAGTGGFNTGGFIIPSTTADFDNGPTPEGKALLDRMVADGVHPATVEAMRDELKANREGVRTTKTAFDHKTNQENLATLRLRIAADPDFTTAAEGNAEFLRLTKKFSAVDRQAFAASENNLADVMSILVPDVEEKRNLGVYNAIENEIRIGQDQLNSMVQHRILNNAIEFGSSDPVTPLMAKLRIGNDGETHPLWGLFGPNMDDNVLRRAISQLAQSIKPPVTDGVAAAAMFDIFDRDPWGTNTTARRFDYDLAKKFIETNLNAAAVQTYREERTRIEDRAGELNKAQLTLTDLRRQKAKTTDKGRKSTLSGQIKQLELILENGQTPREYERAKSDAAQAGEASRALANAQAQPVNRGPDVDAGSAGVQQLPPASLSLTPPPVARPAADFLQLGLGS